MSITSEGIGCINYMFSNTSASIERSRIILPSYSFSTDMFAKEDQLQAYRDEYAVFGRVDLLPGRSARDGFRARRDGYRLGSLRVVLSETEGCSFTSSSDWTYSQNGQDWVLVVRMQGRADIDFGDRVVRYEQGGLELRGGKNRPRGGLLSENRTMFVYLPRDEFSGVEGLMDGLDSGQAPRRMHAILGEYFIALGCALPRLSVFEAQSAAETSLAMVRTCVTHLHGRDADARVPVMASRFQVARKYILNNITSSRLSPEDVCAVLAVSRRQLYYIFEEVGGFYNFVRSLRLEASAKALLEAGRSITSVAAEFGFADSASFSRAFRIRFGCSPSDFRAKSRMPAPSSYSTFLKHG